MRAIVKPLGRQPQHRGPLAIRQGVDGRCRVPLQTTIVGGRVLVFYDSILEALGIDLTKEPADRPKTVTINRTIELTGLSPCTVGRMIAAGRAEQVQKPRGAQEDCSAA